MKIFIIASAVVFLSSCAGNNQQGAIATDTVTSVKPDTLSFFPVTSFIKGQLFVLDSLPVTPLQITTVKGKTDSSWLSKKDLHQHLLPFLTPLITETNLISYFKETKFNDQTINAVTFTYEPLGRIPDSITLRHWDVYVDPERGDVTKIYLVKTIKKGTQFISQQLTWKTNKEARINTLLHKPDGNMELVKEEVIIWDFD